MWNTAAQLTLDVDATLEQRCTQTGSDLQAQWSEGTRAPANYPLILIFSQVTQLLKLFTESVKL